MPDPLSVLDLGQLRARTSIKWRHYPDDVLPAWIAEMDVPMVPAVAEAIEGIIQRGDTGYPFGEHYQRALSRFAEQRWGWTWPVEHSRIMPDVMQGSVRMLELVTDPGDAVIVNPPVYPPFYAFIENAGRRVVEAPLGEDHRLDLEVLDRAFAQATNGGRSAGYLLCSPHNPTGTVHARSELEAVTALASTHGVRVVADEIHAPLVLAGTSFVPFLTVAGSGSGFSVLSASKGWNLAGVKAAVAVAGDQAARDLARVPKEASKGASHVGIQVHVAALEGGVDWLDEVLAGVQRNVGLFAEALRAQLPEARYLHGAATYLAWIDCRDLGLGDDPAQAFLERGKVALNAGLPFGTGGAGHVRVNLATSPEVIQEIVRRMAASV